jgi:SAM-dependent methyltransferase
MKVCASLPAGGEIYRFIQKTFGRLKADPMSRIPTQIEMARWIIEAGKQIEGKTFMEVGTGHDPIVPVGLFLCGADKIVTVDLHQRLDYGILGDSLVWIDENKDDIWKYYDSVVAKSVFDERIELVRRLKGSPKKFLTEANILYLAPADAAETGLPDMSIDYHFSMTVFEHIPEVDIKRIIGEAKRILKKDGLAIHFIDLSDHFQHQDKSITGINFLRYSEKEWDKIADNQFAYCNRLRTSDYLELFKSMGFEIDRKEVNADKEALESIRSGFLVDELFRDYSVADLCATGLRVALKVEENI